MNPVLEAEGLCVCHEGTSLLADIALTLRAGESVAVIGPADLRRTLLLSVLGGLIRPTAGEVRIAGERVNFDQPEHCATLRHTHIGFVARRAPAAPGLTLEDNLRRLAERRGLGQAAADGRARELLYRVGLTPHLEHFPTQLDSPQRQRLAVAHALVHRPAVVLADDPAADLPPAEAAEITQMLVTQAHLAGAALLLTAPQPRVARSFDRILTLDADRLHHQGPPAWGAPLHHPSFDACRSDDLASSTAV